MEASMQTNYTYASALAASQRVNWRVEDIIGGEKRLDFDKPFMPEALARIAPLDSLSAHEKLLLNQIRGHGYLYQFGLVEEFFLLDHTRPRLAGDDARCRAFLQFAGEEAKHIDLFRRFRAEFQKGFSTECEVIGPPEAIAEAVLKHEPLSVALLILHLEWMTQRHFIECIRDDQGLDRQFASMLRHHWMEEAQHAMLDTLMVAELAKDMPEAEIVSAVDGYLEIGGMIDDGLKQQALFDLAVLMKASGRRLGEAEHAKLAEQQHQAQRWTFIGSGMSHPNFLGTVQQLSPASGKRLAEIAPVFR
jgi:hypothetical protein